MRAIPIAFAAFALATLGACEVEQTQEGELPEVDVDATEGQLPQYETEAQDVEVGTTQEEVTVPTIDVEDEQPQQ